MTSQDLLLLTMAAQGKSKLSELIIAEITKRSSRTGSQVGSRRSSMRSYKQISYDIIADHPVYRWVLYEYQRQL